MQELPVEEIVQRMTLDEQVQVFLKKKNIEDFLDAVAKSIAHNMELGVTHPDLKLIRGRSNRKWKIS